MAPRSRLPGSPPPFGVEKKPVISDGFFFCACSGWLLGSAEENAQIQIEQTEKVTTKRKY